MSRADSPLRGRLLFNVGARRSGTYWLQRVITAHPEIAEVPSETYLFSHGIAPLFDRFHHGTISSPEVGKIWANRELVLDRARDLCDAVFAAFAGDARLVAERTPFHVSHLGLISEIYPDSRVIHIIRDGRDVARSLLAQRWGPETVAEAAAEWREAVADGRRAGLEADRYREVRYEKLLAEPEQTVRELYGWLGVEAAPAALQAALAEARRSANVGPSHRGGVGAGKWRQEWGPAELAEFEQAAGGFLSELGYRGPEDRLQRGRWLRRGGRPLRKPRRGTDGTPAIIPAAEPGHLAQRATDRLVEALHGANRDRLGELLGEKVTVEVVAADGTERGRGPEGADLLHRVVARDPAFSRPQRAGETRVGIPWSSSVLTYELADGSVAHRLLCTRAEGEQLREVVLYLPDASTAILTAP